MAIDPAIYDAPRFDTSQRAGFGESLGEYVPPEPVQVRDALAGTVDQSVGAAREAEVRREKAGFLEATGAAISEWSVRRVYDAITKPDFEPDINYKPNEFLANLPLYLNEAERELVLNTVSEEDGQYAVQTIERVRMAQQAMGDNGWGAFLGTMVDPGYLAIDVVSLGAGRLASVGRAAQRAVAGGVATVGAGALGLAEQSVAPVTDMEIVTNALINGAATGLLYSAGRLHRKDPEYPSAALQSHIPKVEPPTGPVVPAKHPVVDVQAIRATGPATGEGLLRQLEGAYRGTDMEPLVTALLRAPEIRDIPVVDIAPKGTGKGVRGSWTVPDAKNPKGRLYIKKGEDGEVALHELYHAVVQSRIFKNPELVRELEGIRKSVRSIMDQMPDKQLGKFYDGQFKKLSEFLAYSATSPAFRKWAQSVNITPDGRPLKALSDADKAKFAEFPAPANRTLWDRIKDLLGRVMGRNTPIPERVPTRYRTLEDRLNEIAYAVTDPSVSPDLARAQSVVGRAGPMDRAVEQARLVEEAGAPAAEGVAQKISWSLYKSLSSLGPEAERIARLLVDDPIDMTGDSVVSQQRAIRADLTPYQYAFEDKLRKAMAKRGAGIRVQVFKPAKALRVQKDLEKQVARELLGREKAAAEGVAYRSDAPAEIKAMADDLDALAKRALDEWKAAGVEGADAVNYREGYFQRRWDAAAIEDVLSRLEAGGMDRAGARTYLRDQLAKAIRVNDTWDKDFRTGVAGALIDRALRKGYFEDTAFRSHYGHDAAAEMRDILTQNGLSGDRLQRAMDVIVGRVDEAGKAPALKHRMDVDMLQGVVLPDGSTIQFMDLIDTSLTRITDQYLDGMSGRAALARKGLRKPSDIQALRSELSHSISDPKKRADGVALFDNTLDVILGRPVGGDMPDLLRNSQALTRMVGLGASGLWQVTEYAAILQKYGALRTMRHMFSKMPGSRDVYRAITEDPTAAKDLRALLAFNSSSDLRMRPFVQRLEDNFHIDPSQTVQLALQQAQQLVPYANAQKYVQQYQARLVSSLVADTLVKGARGNADALGALRKYGLELHIMERAKSDIAQHGMDTAKWSDGTWDAVRAPLLKMMDDAVLRNRTGEIPAFAQFSQVGKFIFTFRSFVLGAHNKVLAGTLGRHGYAGLSLLMLYQMPLALAAVTANGTMRGNPPEDLQDAINKAFGQMSAIGLFSEAWGAVSGDKQQFGAPGLIFADRMYKLSGDVFSGNAGTAAAGALNILPILSLLPPTKALGEALKE